MYMSECRGCYGGVPVLLLPVYEAYEVKLEPVCAPCYGAVMVPGRVIRTLALVGDTPAAIDAVLRATLDEYAALAMAVSMIEEGGER